MPSLILPLAPLPGKLRPSLEQFLGHWHAARRQAYVRIGEGRDLAAIMQELQQTELPDEILAASALLSARRLRQPTGRYRRFVQRQGGLPAPAWMEAEIDFRQNLEAAVEAPRLDLVSLPTVRLYAHGGHLWADIRLCWPGNALAWVQNVRLDMPEKAKPWLLTYFTPVVSADGRLLSRPSLASLTWDGGLAIEVTVPRVRKDRPVLPPAQDHGFWEVSLPRAAAAAALVLGPTLPAVAATYTVQPGDSLIGIGRAHYGSESAWHAIYAANRGSLKSPHRILPGMTLQLPERIGTAKLTPAALASSTAAVPSAGLVVRSGDTLYSLAQRHLGDGAKWNALWQANRHQLRSPGLIYPGMQLQVPGSTSAMAQAPIAAPKPQLASKPAPTQTAAKPAPAQTVAKPQQAPKPAPAQTATKLQQASKPAAAKPAIRPITSNSTGRQVAVQPPILPKAANPPVQAPPVAAPPSPAVTPVVTPPVQAAPVAAKPSMADKPLASAQPPVAPVIERPTPVYSEGLPDWPALTPSTSVTPVPTEPVAEGAPVTGAAPLIRQVIGSPGRAPSSDGDSPSNAPARPGSVATPQAPEPPAPQIAEQPTSLPMPVVEPPAPLVGDLVEMSPTTAAAHDPASPGEWAPSATVEPPMADPAPTAAEAPVVVAKLPSGTLPAKPLPSVSLQSRPFRSVAQLFYNPVSYAEQLTTQDLFASGSITQSLGGDVAWRMADPFELTANYLYSSYRLDRDGTDQAVRSEHHGRMMGYYVFPVLPQLDLAAGVGAQLSSYGTANNSLAGGRTADLFDTSYQRLMLQTEAKVGYMPFEQVPLTLTAGLGVMPWGRTFQTGQVLPESLWGVNWMAGARYSISNIAIEARYRGQQILGTDYQQGNDMMQLGLGYEF